MSGPRVTQELILASGSSARRRMLEAAGVAFRVVPADVDEDALRVSFGQLAPAHLAQRLALAKAEEISRRFPSALVIGGDQVLAVQSAVHTKPANLAAARMALRDLAGVTHDLLSAVCLAQGGKELWRHLGIAHLTMRDFSDAFLDDYLARAGERVCASVGAYELEGLGIQLFDAIEGDYFTILGMPLLPLLAELRARGVVGA